MSLETYEGDPQAPEERHVAPPELDKFVLGESINMARLRRYGREGSGKSFWQLL